MLANSDTFILLFLWDETFVELLHYLVYNFWLLLLFIDQVSYVIAIESILCVK
jgi:hypothetical protein